MKNKKNDVFSEIWSATYQTNLKYGRQQKWKSMWWNMININDWKVAQCNILAKNANILCNYSLKTFNFDVDSKFGSAICTFFFPLDLTIERRQLYNGSHLQRVSVTGPISQHTQLSVTLQSPFITSTWPPQANFCACKFRFNWHRVYVRTL